MSTPMYELIGYLSRAARREYSRMAASLRRVESIARLRAAERDMYREEAARLRGLLENMDCRAPCDCQLARHRAREGRII